jgi:hypothetical protein
MSKSIIAKKTANLNRNSHRTATGWLHDHIDPWDVGVKTPGGPRHMNHNRDIINFRWCHSLNKLTSPMMGLHFQAQRTYYFCGNSRNRDRHGRYARSLLMIDIDCHHGVGTLAGATAFAEHIREHLFPAMYYETSTNGIGIHGYVVVEKDGAGPDHLNNLFRRLKAHLRAMMTDTKADISDVEIMGTIPVYVWSKETQGKIEDYTAGVPAKLPRDVTRWREWTRTTLVTPDDLARIPIHEPAPKVSTIKLSGEKSDPLSSVGSVNRRVFGPDELAKLSGHYLTVAQEILDKPIPVSGRTNVTAKDVAIFLMLVRFFTEKDMNDDGTMPTARFGQTRFDDDEPKPGLWDVLFQAGDVERPFQAKRFTAIRNLLTGQGLLDWEDTSYVVGQRACKWRASDRLLSRLGEEGERDNLLGSSTTNIGVFDDLPNLVNNDFPKPEQVYTLNNPADSFDHKAVDPEAVVPCWVAA